MTNKKKKVSSNKLADNVKKATDKATKVAGDVFENLKKHLEPAKVDAFQEKWLAVPANRKKYKKISDAPQIAAEELLAMTDDLINFAQGQEGGKSKALKKIKSGVGGFLKNPAKFLQDKAGAEKKTVKKTTGKAKPTAKKAAPKKK